MDTLTNLSLFSGAGGLDLAAKRTGRIETVCYVENDLYCQAVLMSRFRDRQLDEAPIWDDVKTFDGKPWCGIVDIVSGGFPCQDLSVAGRRKGIRKENRSGLWHEFRRIICEVKPRWVLVENVPGLLSNNAGGDFGIILRGLAEAGCAAEWFCFSASDAGAPHIRERVWVVADADGQRRQQKSGSAHGDESENEGRSEKEMHKPASDGERRGKKDVADSFRSGFGGGDKSGLGSERQEIGQQEDRACPADQSCHRGEMGDSEIESKRTGLRQIGKGKKRGRRFSDSSGETADTDKQRLEKRQCQQRMDGMSQSRPERQTFTDDSWWSAEPDVGRVANRVAFRVDRLRCCGNGVVPQQAVPAWEKILKMAEE